MNDRELVDLFLETNFDKDDEYEEFIHELLGEKACEGDNTKPHESNEKSY